MVALDSTSHWLAHRVDRVAPDIFCWKLFDIYFPLKLGSIRIWNPVFVCVASEFFHGIGCVELAIIELTRNRQICSMSTLLACLQQQVHSQNTRQLNQGEILNWVVFCLFCSYLLIRICYQSIGNQLASTMPLIASHQSDSTKSYSRYTVTWHPNSRPTCSFFFVLVASS